MPLSCSSVTEETPRCPVAQGEHTAWSLFRHADVSRSCFNHLQNGIQHADHRAERPILALVEATQAVEMPEQLVRAVD